MARLKPCPSAEAVPVQGWALPFLADQVIELWMFADVVGDERADYVHLELLVAGVFEGGAGEGCGDSSSAKSGWHFGVPEGHPSLVVAVELEPSGFAILIELESALGYFARVGHVV